MDGFSPSTSNLQSNFSKVNCASPAHMSRQYSKFYYAQNCNYFILRMYICFRCVQNCNSFNTRSRLLSKHTLFLVLEVCDIYYSRIYTSFDIRNKLLSLYLKLFLSLLKSDCFHSGSFKKCVHHGGGGGVLKKWMKINRGRGSSLSVCSSVKINAWFFKQQTEFFLISCLAVAKYFCVLSLVQHIKVFFIKKA